MTTYRIQWRLREYRRAFNGDEKWHDISGESYRLEEHALLRKAAFWEKEFEMMEFRVEAETTQKCPTEST